MAKTIIITNGVATDNIANGSYEVSANVSGYDNASLNPSHITVSEGVSEYAFTIGANGNLTIHVTEDGTSGGTPVVGATFYRTDSEGTVYGDAVVTDSEGNAILANVPYGDGALAVYYKQTASDGSHEFSDEVLSITMTNQNETVEITNQLASVRTISLVDANYANLPLDGSLTLL